MEVIGRIKKIEETKEYGSNGFKKREIVITTQEQYPQHILIEFVQDKCAILDSYKEGQDVKIAFNLRGREWINPEGVAKYFNSLNGWRIELVQAEAPAPVAPPQNMEQVDPTANDNEADDLPF
jgi:translation initiation factor IF-3